MKKGYLVLQDGQVFEGERFGAETDSVGELIVHYTPEGVTLTGDTRLVYTGETEY